MYDLQKLSGVTDLEIADASHFAFMEVVGNKTELQIAEEELAAAKVNLAELQNKKRPSQANIKKADKLVKTLADKVEKLKIAQDQAQADAEEQAQAEASAAATTENPTSSLAEKVLELTEVPEGAPADYKFVSGEELTPLREEFPFLDDPNCPEIMFVVVGKRISAHRAYSQLHAKLQEINDGTLTVPAEEKDQITKDCDAAYTENRLLWDELNYYGTEGKILGKHKLFRETVTKREVEAMDNEKLLSFRDSSPKFFSTKRTALKGEKDQNKIDKINQSVADREYKLKLVNAKLNVSK